MQGAAAWVGAGGEGSEAERRSKGMWDGADGGAMEECCLCDRASGNEGEGEEGVEEGEGVAGGWAEEGA